VEEAIAAADRAFPAWSAESLSKRTQMMFRWRNVLMEHVDELTLLCATELGKNLDEARGDVLKAVGADGARLQPAVHNPGRRLPAGDHGL
jgi:malonate-semialdehyde dehydrogenase (acetylating)/methylmalonate-semialdehyde dehydrogenase